ncbi:hypothetical protein TeGR_g13740 [Tetraparma gracilis]|uniref:O-acyltransferase WSD1 C-terminal domain-containing protein n=1 Tax=Tetraparma gracilis TaxID=2962635 RepID=A0ABQ6M981_9STRA|nr:hypothetical protein TeGR_g13740 [Tetraparma gracilis]
MSTVKDDAMSSPAPTSATPVPSSASKYGEKSKRRGPKLVLLSESFHRQLIQRDQSPIIHAIMAIKSEPTDSDVSAVLTKAVTTYPLFGATVSAPTGCGCTKSMYWELDDSPVDGARLLQDHVTRVTLTPTLEGSELEDDFNEFDRSNNTSIDKALREHVSSLIGTGFDLTKGGFQLHVIRYEDQSAKKKSIQRCDMLWRMHHGIGDGIMLSKVLISLCEEIKGAEDAAPARASPKRAKKKISPFVMAGKAFYSVGKVLGIPLFHDPKTLFKAPTNYKKMGKAKSYGATRVWSLQAAKDAGKPFGATLNDVVMAALSLAMRRYMIKREDPAVMGKKGKKLSVRALAVVNTRAAGAAGDRLLEDFSKCKSPNEFSYVVPTLPVGEMSVRERVLACNKDMNSLKSSPEAFVIKKLNNGIRDVLGGAFTLAFNADYVINRLTCFFSNLPGPTSKLSCCEVEVERLSNFVHPMMYSCGLSIQSYNGEIVTNCSCDSKLIPDPDVFMAMADEAFDEICEDSAKYLSEQQALLDEEI